MLRDRPPRGPSISKHAAMYTRDMHHMIRSAFKKPHENQKEVNSTPSVVESLAKRLEFADALRPVEFTERLRGHAHYY